MDWTGRFQASPELNRALQLYETKPGMATALGVLNHFSEFKNNESMRKSMLASDPVLFHTVDIAKYEVVMQVRKRLGVKRARRLGSTGQREYNIIQWVKKVDSGGSMDPIKPLDPQKILYSDDDNMFLVSADEAYKNPAAHEAVNGRNAKKAFAEITREYMPNSPDPDITGSCLEAETVETEFLSPTKAWDVIKSKGAEGDWPNYLFAWTASDPEKYNDAWGVEMLERWGWEKGAETRDVNNPVETTHLIRDLYPELNPAGEPKPPSEDPTIRNRESKRIAHQFAYIANNYKQIYGVHKGHFLSQCKYLVRMIDSWEAVAGPESLPPDYADARRKAFAIYTSGAEGGIADSFKSEVGPVIDRVVETAHSYHLEKIGGTLIESLKNAGVSPDQTISMETLTRNNPRLLRNLNGLVVAYSNIPAELQQKLLKQYAERISAGEQSRDSGEIYKSRAFKHILEVVQNEADFTRNQIGSFRQIRADIELSLNEHLKGTDLDQFIEQVAKGQFSGEELRLTDDYRIRRVRRQMTPENVVRDLDYIHSVADLFGWSSVEYSRRLKEYIAEGPSTALSMLRRIHDIFDTGRARPVHVSYEDADGNLVQKSLEPNERSLGIDCFKAALKGYEIWGKVQHGKTLYTNIYQIYGVSGRSDEEIGRLQAQALASTAEIYEFLRSDILGQDFRLYGSGTTSEIILGTPGAALTGDPESQKKLAAAAFKDVILAWQPELAPAFLIYDLSSWAYNEYNLRGSKSDIIEAMVENGQWGRLKYVKVPIVDRPGKFQLQRQVDILSDEELKKLNASDAAKLGIAGIRKSKNDTPQNWRNIARNGFKVTIKKTGQTIETRKSLMEVAYRGNYLQRSTVLKSTEDSIRSLDQHSWAFGGILPQDTRNWTHKALSDKGIAMVVKDDSTGSIPSPASEIKLDQIYSDLQSLYPFTRHLRLNQLRLLSSLVADFWKKRQELLEKHVLRDLEKEAARRFVAKMRGQSLQDGDFDFAADIAGLDKAVAQIDKKLWPRVERSADLFPGPGYNPEKDTPILESYRRSTAAERNNLKRYQDFLSDPEQTSLSELQILPGTNTILGEEREEVELDRKQVTNKAANIINSMRESYYKIDEGYSKVHTLLDQGKKLAGEGMVTLEPFHLAFKPGEFSLIDMSQYGVSPTASDQKTAAAWLGEYKEQRKKIAKDVYEKAKDLPKVHDFWSWADSHINLDQGADTSPSHPLWPDLVRLRIQIQKLTFIQGFLHNATAEELRRQIGRMTIKKDQPAVLPDNNASLNSATVRSLIKDMEEEYNRLLDSLSNLFEIDLAINPDPKEKDPFIGQEVQVTGKLKQTEAVTSVKLARNGFPDYVDSFEWRVHNERYEQIGKSKITKDPVWKGYFPITGLHLVEIRALDKGRNILSSQTIGANPQPVMLTGNLVSEEGAYEDEAISILVTGKKIGDISHLGRFEIKISNFDIADWRAKNPAKAQVQILGRSSISNASGIQVTPESGILSIAEDLSLKFPHAVTVVTEVVDRAKLPVEKAEVTVHVDGRPLNPGDSIATRIWRDQTVSARILFSPLGLIENTPLLRFNPDESLDIHIQAELPIFDAEHLTVQGELTIGPVTDRLNTGTLDSNLKDSWTVAAPEFSFTNQDPIDLRAPAEIRLSAIATDSSNRLYRTQAPEVRIIGNEAKVDLGTIFLESVIQKLKFELTDWVTTPLPMDKTSLHIENLPASRANGRLILEWPLKRQSQDLVVEAAFQMPNDTPAQATRMITLRGWDLRSAPPGDALFQLKLPVYLNLNVAVSSSIDISSGAAHPAQIRIERVETAGGSIDVNRTVNAFNPGNITLPQPIALKAPNGQVNTVTLYASASENGVHYKGSGTGTVPLQPSASTVALRLTPDKIAMARVPNVIGQPITQALHLIQQADLNPKPIGGDPAPTIEEQFTVQSQIPNWNSLAPIKSEVKVKIFGEFDINSALQNHRCSDGSIAAWNPDLNKPQCICPIPLQWNRERTACIDQQTVERENRCNQINEALKAASKAGNLNYFRQLLASAQDCDFFQRASQWLQNADRCNQIKAALAAASKANNIKQFRHMVQQAKNCGFYQNALAHLNNWERNLQRQQQQQQWNALIQTWGNILQSQNQTPAPAPSQGSSPGIAPGGGTRVSKTEKTALEREVIQTYENAWYRKYCKCSYSESKTDPTCLRRMPSGCILHPRSVKERLLSRILTARTHEDLQRVRQAFQCSNSCLMQKKNQKCTDACFSR